MRQLQKTAKVLACLALCASQAAPALAAPVTLAPISKWNVEWSKTTCTLRRVFGTSDRPSVLIFERYGPTDSFQLTLISNEFRNYQQGGRVSLAFGNQTPRFASPLPGKTDTGTASLFFGSRSLSSEGDNADDWDHPVTHATEAATTSVTIAYYGKSRVFATGPLDKPFDALRQCTDDLVKFWGLDPAQQATLSKRVKPLQDPGTWLMSKDYPREMLFVGAQALINFRLSVDAQGMPTACEIQRSYNDKVFDETTCAILMRRARFSPALDASGKPVPSYFISAVRWVMSNP